MEFIKDFFKFDERGTDLSTEIIAGITTFLAMAYILPVNSTMLSATGIPFAGVFFATAVAAAIASILMGILANIPVALAPGMGLNAFFTYTLVYGAAGLSWQAALAAVLVSGVLFFIISISGLRKMVINAIPTGLKYAVGAGIGFFITFIGLQGAGIIVGGPTLVELGDLSHPTVLLGIFGIFLVIILHAMGNRFALILSIFVTAIVGLLLGLIFPDAFTTVAQFSTGEEVDLLLMPSYKAEGLEGLWVGIKGTVGQAFTGFGELFRNPGVFGIIFTLLFVDFFDTAGTLMAVGNEAGLVDENGELIGSENALLVDSIGTMTGAVLGTSNVTSYIESATGIEQGGRSGLSSIVVGVLFLLSLLIYPLLSVVNGVAVGIDSFDGFIVYSPVTAMALVLVGALMVRQFKDIDWSDKAIVIPSFLTVIFMILTYSIAQGIAVGFIFYPIIMLAQKRYKEVNPVMYVLGLLFLLNFVITAI
ncbi:MAG: NCS2 family permease [Candidatus Izemoplasma sp.]|nr:NCS2 family permease [Candidatus Izemoplasma sp.]